MLNTLSPALYWLSEVHEVQWMHLLQALNLLGMQGPMHGRTLRERVRVLGMVRSSRVIVHQLRCLSLEHFLGLLHVMPFVLGGVLLVSVARWPSVTSESYR